MTDYSSVEIFNGDGIRGSRMEVRAVHTTAGVDTGIRETMTRADDTAQPETVIKDGAGVIYPTIAAAFAAWELAGSLPYAESGHNPHAML